MQENIRFNPAAFRHGITEDDIRKAIETKIYEGPIYEHENKYAVIGFDIAGNLLEIMYNIIDSQSINIFHAMKCRNGLLNNLKN